MLIGPTGALVERSAMTRRLPHDITNALAAAAIVLESGLATSAAVAEALATFQHPPHRIEPVGTIGGAAWFNDSKATTPHAALTAIRGFDKVVLLAGGRNKGLDLASLANEHARIKAVVAFGEAASIVADAFAHWCPAVVAETDGAAVTAAAGSHAGRHGAALAGVCQLRLVPRRRLSRPRRRLQTPRPQSLRRSGPMSSSTTLIGDRRRQALDRAAALRRHPSRRMAARPTAPPTVAFYAIDPQPHPRRGQPDHRELGS